MIEKAPKYGFMNPNLEKELKNSPSVITFHCLICHADNNIPASYGKYYANYKHCVNAFGQRAVVTVLCQGCNNPMNVHLLDTKKQENGTSIINFDTHRN